MNRLALKYAGVVSAVFLSLSACSGTADRDSGADPATKAINTPPKKYGSVIDLRDAAVDAGYICNDWVAENRVSLAAESGSCNDASVLSIYASQSDLQAQLDQEKSNAELMTDADLETTPILVGENWLFKDPEASSLRSELGGVLIGAKR